MSGSWPTDMPPASACEPSAAPAAMPMLKTAEMSDEASSGAAAAPKRMRFCTPIDRDAADRPDQPERRATPTGHHQAVPSQVTTKQTAISG